MWLVWNPVADWENLQASNAVLSWLLMALTVWDFSREY